MKIVISEQSPTDPKLLQEVITAWDAHPLRKSMIDQRLKAIKLIVVETEDDYGLNADHHPEYWLKCALKPTDVSISVSPIIFHELTHIIDRFDLQFTGGRKPEQVSSIINAIPDGNANESIKRAFNRYWNTYIDGRLNRKGVVVYTLEKRVAQKLGRRQQAGEAAPGERESIEKVWNQEPYILNELIELANRYPERRSRKDWITYPADSV